MTWVVITCSGKNSLRRPVVYNIPKWEGRWRSSMHWTRIGQSASWDRKFLSFFLSLFLSFFLSFFFAWFVSRKRSLEGRNVGHHRLLARQFAFCFLSPGSHWSPHNLNARQTAPMLDHRTIIIINQIGRVQSISRAMLLLLLLLLQLGHKVTIISFPQWKEKILQNIWIEPVAEMLLFIQFQRRTKQSGG